MQTNQIEALRTSITASDWLREKMADIVADHLGDASEASLEFCDEVLAPQFDKARRAVPPFVRPLLPTGQEFEVFVLVEQMMLAMTEGEAR